MQQLVYCRRELTVFLSQVFEEIKLANGSQLAVFKHFKRGKVWILSFDTKRYDFYQMLGIKVGQRYQRAFMVWKDDYVLHEPKKDSGYAAKYDLFECERLHRVPLTRDTEELFQRFDRAVRNPQLPLPEPELEALFYAWLSTHGHTPVGIDWGNYNMLTRSDGTLFLSDVLNHYDSWSPSNIWFDPTDLKWIESTMKGLEYANQCSDYSLDRRGAGARREPA